MKKYSVSGNERETVILINLLSSLFIAQILYPLFCNLSAHITNDEIKSILSQFEIIGIIGNPATVMGVYAILSKLFDCVFWKIPFIIKLTKVPNLNGKWVGQFDSVRDEHGKQVHTKGSGEMDIKQTWSRISCICTFKKSISENGVTFIDCKNCNDIRLKFIYHNNSREPSLGLPEYTGYNELVYTAPNELKGDYFTKRIPATRGTLNFERKK